MAFPIDAFVNAHKYKAEKDAERDNWGKVIGESVGTGISAGLQARVARKQKAEETADATYGDVVKNWLKDRDYFLPDGTPGDAQQTANAMSTISVRGSQLSKPMPDGTIAAKDNKGNIVGFWKMREDDTKMTEIIPTEANIEQLKKIAPLYNWEMGVGKKLPVTTANALLKAINNPAAEPLSDDAINNAADIYNATGNMPALGMGNAQMRKDILDRAAERAKSAGQSSQDLVRNRVTFKAQSQAVSSLSGTGARLQDAKVNQAIDLRQMLDQNYDPKTGEYNVPPALHAELALGMAKLLSPSGTVAVEMEQQLRQKTAREGLAGALIFLGFDPSEVGGSTQGVIKMFAHSIDRQGEVAEDLRNQYLSQDKTLGNMSAGSSFRGYLGKSPSRQQAQPAPQQGQGGVQQNRIRVRVKATGDTGTIEPNEFDETIYERL